MSPTAERRSPPRLWLARTGEGGYALTDCVRAGVVALRYTYVGDATSLTVTEIAEGVRRAGTRDNHTAVAQMLFEFVHTVRQGDIVVTTHRVDRDVYFGEVTGDYRFADPSPVPEFRHLRDVQWWGSLDRDTDIAADRLVDIDRPPNFYEVPHQDYWLDRAHHAHLPDGLSPNTSEQYRSIVDKHLIPAFDRVRLKALTPADVEAMLRRKAAMGLSPSTCMRIRSVLQMALHKAQVEGHVHRNVADLARRPKVTHEERRSLTVEEAKRLLKVVQGTSMEAALTVMLLHGLRPGEAMGLTWDDIDFDERVLWVRRSLKREPAGLRLGEVKTAKSKRPLAMPGLVFKALRRRKTQQAEELLRAGVGAPPDNLVFTTSVGTPIDPSNLRRALTQVATAAELGRWKPYELRHSCASILCAAGVPLEQIADILGHKGVRMTAEVYRHRVDPVIDSGVAPMEALFGDGSP